jgi:hypothetical protein
MNPENLSTGLSKICSLFQSIAACKLKQFLQSDDDIVQQLANSEENYEAE